MRAERAHSSCDLRNQVIAVARPPRESSRAIRTFPPVAPFSVD